MIDDDADSDAPAADAFDVPARAPLRALLLPPPLLLELEQQRNRAALAAALARSRRRRIVERVGAERESLSERKKVS